MNQALLNSMTVTEQRLVAETSRDAMSGLDEEELLALHARIRRAARVASGRRPAPSRPRGAKKTTGGLKKDASTRAKGARRQARRDSR